MSRDSLAKRDEVRLGFCLPLVEERSLEALEYLRKGVCLQVGEILSFPVLTTQLPILTTQLSVLTTHL